MIKGMEGKEELLEKWRSSKVTSVVDISLGGIQGEYHTPKKFDTVCTSCFNSTQSYQLSCGHKVCQDCARSIAKCHECGKFVSNKPKPIRKLSGVQHLAEVGASVNVAKVVDLLKEQTAQNRNSSSDIQATPINKNPNLFVEADNGAPICEFCALHPIGIEFGCLHQACQSCAGKLHACPTCGKLINHKTLLANKFRSKFDFILQEGEKKQKKNSSVDEDGIVNFCSVCNQSPKRFTLLCDGGCRQQTCGSCLSHVRACLACDRGIKTIVPLENTYSPSSPDTKLKKSKEHLCHICENRPRAAIMTCKAGCHVDTCGPCTAKHRKCFLCQRKVKEIKVLHNSINATVAECDVCGIYKRRFMLKCKMGCRFRTCVQCTRSKKQCCGFRLKNVGIIGMESESPAASPENLQATPNEKMGPASLLNVSRKLFERVSEDTNIENLEYREYKDRKSAKQKLEMILPTLEVKNGGFMGYA